MASNNRRHHRVKPRLLSARLRVGGKLHIGVAVQDLSLGGAYVRCLTPTEVDAHVVLDILVPGLKAPLRLPGRVAYVVSPADAEADQTEPGFAIGFNEPLPPHTHLGLERLLAAIDPKALIPLETLGSSATVITQVHTPGSSDGELQALRKLVQANERELTQLRSENARLRAELDKEKVRRRR